MTRSGPARKPGRAFIPVRDRSINTANPAIRLRANPRRPLRATRHQIRTRPFKNSTNDYANRRPAHRRRMLISVRSSLQHLFFFAPAAAASRPAFFRIYERN